MRKKPENQDLLALVASIQVAVEHCPEATAKMVTVIAQQHVNNLKAYILMLESKQNK